MTIRMKAGDTTPAVEAELTDANDNAVDLSEVDTMSFELRDRFGDEVFSKSADVVDDLGGEVEYNWDDGDTDEPGDYRGQFVVTFENGEDQLTVPTREWIDVFIEG